MLRSLKEIFGYKIEAIDGVFGKARDFLFDDRSWGVRYLVADTGDWLLDRRVLISPLSVGEPIWSGGVIPVALTKEQVEDSPGIESHPPVTRRYERIVTDFYSWQGDWPQPMSLGMPGMGILAPALTAPAEEPESRPASDPHLQSARDVIGYHAEAHDGEVGRVADYLVQTEGWVIRYLVVDTRRWLPGRRVLVSPAWVTVAEGAERVLRVNLKREELRSSLEFDPSAPVNCQHEVRLYDYYGRPRYWEAAGDRAGTWHGEGRRVFARRRWKALRRARQVRTLREEEPDHVGGTQASTSDPGRL